jgi:hypothetical protein
VNSPLNEFADRLINNGEVSLFIKGLIEKGMQPEIIIKAVQDSLKGRIESQDSLKGRIERL